MLSFRICYTTKEGFADSLHRCKSALELFDRCMRHPSTETIYGIEQIVNQRDQWGEIETRYIRLATIKAGASIDEVEQECVTAWGNHSTWAK